VTFAHLRHVDSCDILSLRSAYGPVQASIRVEMPQPLNGPPISNVFVSRRRHFRHDMDAKPIAARLDALCHGRTKVSHRRNGIQGITVGLAAIERLTDGPAPLARNEPRIHQPINSRDNHFFKAFSMAARMNAARLPVPAAASICATAVAGMRSMMATVLLELASDGRPRRRGAGEVEFAFMIIVYRKIVTE
jgi:hypothetical protein